MARKQRIEFDGAFYHIIVRGNQKQKVFKSRIDFLKYLELLAHYKERYDFSLYSYALMPNHVHLLLETHSSPLSKILQGINQSYTMYFNKTYKTMGHLFQGRYKAILCDKDEYLLSLLKYIHLNPVRAKIVQAINDYPWTSHYSYKQKSDPYNLIETGQILKIFSENKRSARRLYKIYIEDKVMVKKEEVYSTVDQRILGDEKFVEKVKRKYVGELNKERREKEFLLADIALGVEKITGVTHNQIQNHVKFQPKITQGRRLFSLIASDYGYKGKEIAEFIRKDPALVTRYLKQREDLEPEIKKVIKILKKNKDVNFQV